MQVLVAVGLFAGQRVNLQEKYDYPVRHLIGLDPRRGGVAVADTVAPGMRLAFCLRDVVRNCTEIRDEVEAPAPQAFLHTRGDALDAAPKRIQWAIYVSCSGRGGPPFGGTSAELKLAQHALGKVPLAGFFAAGEIARQHLYYQTGVLTAFTGA